MEQIDFFQKVDESMAVKDEITFENALKRLEEIIQKLENDASTLDDTLAQFEEGKKLVNICLKKLETAEQKFKILFIIP